MLGLRIWVRAIACLTSEIGGLDLSPNPYLVEFKESVLSLRDDARLALESGLLAFEFLPFFFFAGLALIYGISSMPK